MLVPMSQNVATVEGRLAVCSWSLQAANPRELVARMSETCIRRVQLALDPLRESAAVWGDTETLLRRHEFEMVSGMFGCVGEDYSTLETIRATGGIAPDSTWAQNLNSIRASAEIAAGLGLPLVTFHAGFLPHEKSDPAFRTMRERMRAVADIFAAKQIALGLETGQETAPALAAFLTELERPNVGVNFDPANMILYDKGNPVGALRVLAPWLRQVHIKDATHTPTPGTWGTEVAAGAGEVDWPGFFAALRAVNFTGNLVIEREAGNQRVADIVTARQLVSRQLQN
jgi:L-ribulose-5-phosphate 3-epimerase